MHIDIAASELVNTLPEAHYKMQCGWREEIKNCLQRMKRSGIHTSSSDDEAELIKKRKDELSHAQDIREHYERKLERANNLYMELTACLLQLEQRERELIRRENAVIGGKGNKRQIVAPLLQAAQERISSSRRASYRPDNQIVNSSPVKANNDSISCQGSARSRIKRSRQRRSINSGQNNSGNISHQPLTSPLNSGAINYSPRPSPLQERKSFVDTETQTDSVFSESDLVSPSSSTLSPMSAIGRVETVIDMGDNDVIRGLPKTSTTSTFDSGYGDCQSCLSTPTARTASDRSPVTPISGKSSSVETDTEDFNRSKIKSRSTNLTQNIGPSLSSIDENGVQCNSVNEVNDFCDVAIVRRGSITCQRRYNNCDFNKLSQKSSPFIAQRPILHHVGSNISIDSHNSSSTDEEEGAVDSDDYRRRPSSHLRNGFTHQLQQHRLSGQSISTLSSEGNLSDEEEGNTSEYSSNHNDIVSSLSNPDLSNVHLESSQINSSVLSVKVSQTFSKLIHNKILIV
jgi:mitogen-activated protein kinase kinase kinase 13